VPALIEIPAIQLKVENIENANLQTTKKRSG
jgi:hypothetical protein